jgi:16S rRNA (guanine966-N2)-methyltransferase
VRIVAGKHRGRTLAAPSGRDTRPTTDRTREALFNILAHADWAGLDGVRVLDGFCGTGALGLEALSRGAVHATFMDIARAALDCTRANAASLGEGAAATVLRADPTRPPKAPAPCGLIFLDPPYRKELASAALPALRRAGWIAGAALCVVEEAADAPFSPPDGFSLLERRCYGDTAIYFVGASATGPTLGEE